MDKIRRMNKMYDLPISDVPKCPTHLLLDNFHSILSDEVEEIEDIIEETTDGSVDRIVAFADLLADVIVYCKSEALKFGIPIDEVFDIVMESNFSKLGEDGLPIKDERGKFLKGPNYWKPEPKIKELILERMKQEDTRMFANIHGVRVISNVDELSEIFKGDNEAALRHYGTSFKEKDEP